LTGVYDSKGAQGRNLPIHRTVWTYIDVDLLDDTVEGPAVRGSADLCQIDLHKPPGFDEAGVVCGDLELVEVARVLCLIQATKGALSER